MSQPAMTKANIKETRAYRLARGGTIRRYDRPSLFKRLLNAIKRRLK